MAMGKNKTGIMAAISAATEGAGRDGQDRAQRSLPRGTIGSVRAGLGGIQEIAADQILAWGPQDRLGSALESATELEDLIESIRASGQQVPVLLRPSVEQDGKFEVIYGRRRIRACAALKQPVKALIRTLDDTEALMAKGLENASRTDLSYYERARFAEGILAQGYTRAEVIQALAVSKNTLSQMERITRLVPSEAGDAIGAAPGHGRPKWMALAAAFEKNVLTVGHVLKSVGALPPGAGSDARLEAVMRDLAAQQARPKAPPVAARAPVPGVEIKAGGSNLTLSVKKTGQSKPFAEWLDQNLDGLLESAFQRFQAESRGG